MQSAVVCVIEVVKIIICLFSFKVVHKVVSLLPNCLGFKTWKYILIVMVRSQEPGVLGCPFQFSLLCISYLVISLIEP